VQSEAVTENPSGGATPEDPLAVFNSEGVYQTYVRRLDDNLRQADLIVSGIHCAGCVRAIERGLVEAGAAEAQVNFGNHRASVTWDDSGIRLAEILRALRRLGYDGHPYDPHTQELLHRRELRQAVARLGVAGFGAGNVMLYSVGLYAGYFYGMETGFRQLFQWISLLLCLPVVFYSGWPFLRGAWGGLRTRRLNMDSLISLGILTTFCYSLAALLVVPGAETYFDSVVMITFFLLVGRTLEGLARSRAGGVTERLMGLQVKWATRLGAGGEETVPIQAVRAGDRLLVRVGDALPTDGVAEQGESELDESALTGEFQPRFVAPGEAVLGGTVNLGAPLVMRSTRVGADTVLARICRLVERAQHEKPPVQRLADRVASKFVTVILALAAATLVFWQFFYWGAPPQSPWIIAISVLIIACPCALGLATPVAVLVGSAAAARRGVMVKGGEVLERGARVTDVVLDKTGTLTTAGLEVRALHDLGGLATPEWFAAAVALERWVAHPIADAFRSYWELAPFRDAVPGALPAPGNVEVLPGRGARGRVKEREVLVGTARLLEEARVALPPQAGSLANEAAGPAVYVAIDGAVAGLVLLADPLRPDAADAVAALRRMGLDVHLFSGDRPATVARAAAAAGIADARGDMLPDAKLEALRELQAEGRVVAFVGDGINDAPALTQADLGLAVGSGSDISLEAAQVVLVGSRLLGAVDALAVARSTLGVIRQNLGLSLAYNGLAVPLAMAGHVMPLFAALAMSASSLLVVLNSLRLHRAHAALPHATAPAARPAPLP
jgi:Cu2+-exporting ATPase